MAVRASVRNRYPASAWGLAIDAGCHHGRIRGSYRNPGCRSPPDGRQPRHRGTSSLPAGASTRCVPRLSAVVFRSACGRRVGSWRSKETCWSGPEPFRSVLFPSRQSVKVPTGWRFATSPEPGAICSESALIGGVIRSVESTGPRPRGTGSSSFVKFNRAPWPGCRSSLTPTPRHTPVPRPTERASGRSGSPRASSKAGPVKGSRLSSFWTGRRFVRPVTPPENRAAALLDALARLAPDVKNTLE